MSYQIGNVASRSSNALSGNLVQTEHSLGPFELLNPPIGFHLSNEENFWEFLEENVDAMETLEETSVLNFFKKFEKYGDYQHIFEFCSFRNAIQYSCLAPEDEQKGLLLYLHKENVKFCETVCAAFADTNSELKVILEDSFNVLPWDIETETEALLSAISKWPELDVMKTYIEKQQPALFIILNSNGNIFISSKFHDDITGGQLLFTLQTIRGAIFPESHQPEDAPRPMGATEFQQMMCDRLGDRDYDEFTANEHEELKLKIGFSKFGPPGQESGYDEEQKNIIEEAYQAILLESNKHAQFDNHVIMACVYNCLKPLSDEIAKRKEKYPDYDECTDIMPVPVYVFRKCFDSFNPCRVIIDHDNRVYQSWSDYIENNKIHKCEMIVPKNGRYTCGGDGVVCLSTRLSPACGIGQIVLRGADITSSGIGLGSAGVFAAALIPSVAVAPVALIGAGVAGGVVGVYSIIRSSMTIHDRRIHRQSMSFANSEARGAYLNIVAGSVGFVGAGATMAVSKLVSRGVQIGTGAKCVLNTINGINIGVSGGSVVNSTYEVIHNGIKNKKVCPLAALQLTTSILFFSHAVVNFKTANVIVDEAQNNYLSNYKDSLRSNRHRKMFNKLVKETTAQNNNVQEARAEVISTLRKTPNKDETFAFLTRNNKQFNKYGIKFAAKDGKITLNGMSIDISNMDSKLDLKSFFSNLPPPPKRTAAQIEQTNVEIGTVVKCVLHNAGIATKLWKMYMDGDSVPAMCGELLQHFSQPIQRKITKIITAFCKKIPLEEWSGICMKTYPTHPLVTLFKLVIEFIHEQVNSYAKEYQRTHGQSNTIDIVKKTTYWLNKIMNIFVNGGNVSQVLLQMLVNWTFTKLISKLMKQQQSRPIPNGKKACSTCGGFFYG